jgi:peptidoglycan/LPS O-acetylase OafA/YrhL
MLALNSPLAADMVLSTGKAINDLGDVDRCRLTPGLRYGTLQLAVIGLPPIALGLCLPEGCRRSDMQIIIDAFKSQAGPAVASAEFNFIEEVSVEMTAARAVGISFYILLAIICLLGALVEYTPLFNSSDAGEIKPEDDAAKHKNLIGRFFVSFSPPRNLYKLFYSSFDSSDNLKVFNGARVLSMLYVVFGHSYFSVLLVPTSNTHYIPELIQYWWFSFVTGAFFAVDVFFFLSAFLGIYLLLAKFPKGTFMNIPLIYFHRFFRLAPNVILVIMFFTTFYEYFGVGPVWLESTKVWIADCPRDWWTFVLFINSIYRGDQSRCLGWLWYLSHDMIFFVTLPIQAWIYRLNRCVGYFLAIFIFLSNLGVVCGLTIYYDISSSVLTDPNYGSKLYFRPWARYGAYQVGILFGMLYYEYVQGKKDDDDYAEEKKRIGYSFFNSIGSSKIFRYICYTLGLGLILTVVYIITPENRSMPNRHFGIGFNAVYNPLSRPAYVFGLGLILAGPLAGRGSFLQDFLGSRFWAPWAKLTFYNYLVHLFVFTFFFGQMRTSFFLYHKSIIWYYLGVMFLTLVVSIPLSVFLEAPWMQLEKLVLFPSRQKKEEEETEGKNYSLNGSELGTSINTQDNTLN